MSFPRPRHDDEDDVVWALQTARVQWDRGARADAIVWIRRASDAALQTGAQQRATELRGRAESLVEFLWSDAPVPDEEPEDVPTVGRSASSAQEEEGPVTEEVQAFNPPGEDALEQASAEEAFAYDPTDVMAGPEGLGGGSNGGFEAPQSPRPGMDTDVGGDGLG